LPCESPHRCTHLGRGCHGCSGGGEKGGGERTAGKSEGRERRVAGGIECGARTPADTSASASFPFHARPGAHALPAPSTSLYPLMTATVSPLMTATPHTHTLPLAIPINLLVCVKGQVSEGGEEGAQARGHHNPSPPLLPHAHALPAGAAACAPPNVFVRQMPRCFAPDSQAPRRENGCPSDTPRPA